MSDFNIEEELKKLPGNPGVYIMHDVNDTIIYVGKAVNLKNRVRSYFRAGVFHTAKINKMISLIDHFEYIITDSELEALVLENNLIKENSPKYNTLLKDDKTYPYIKVTVSEDYPRILFCRQMKKDKSKYFGPYTSAQAVKETIDLMNKLYKIRTCNRTILPPEKNENPDKRACLNYHIKQCAAPCRGDVTVEEYRENVNRALEFLNGNYGPILKSLEEKMKDASERLAFEEAAEIRELYFSVKSVAQKQKITDYEGEDKDYIGLAKNEKDALIQLFFVRGGKLIGREHFYFEDAAEEENEELTAAFIKQFYAGTPYIPAEIFISYELPEKEVLEEWLSKKREHKVSLISPKKGQKEKLLDLAVRNAALILSQDTEKLKRQEARTIGAVREIEEILGIPSIKRMEAFDISNTSGFANVASMVVFEKGKPKRSDYRKFRMKTVTGPDDYACMREALTRRFEHGLALRGKNVENNSNDSFVRFPDLLLMDGGKGQVNIAEEVLASLGINVPVCGMVKDDNHHTRGLYFHNVEMPIDTRSEGFKLITRVQDEAHRFAIEYHRSLRTKAQVHSVLDEIPGIGEKRRRALMKAFSSIDELKKADVAQIAAIPEIPESVAKGIYDFLHGNGEQ
ncbi:MAG: excinuclease ABC subunit UvrC [Lachnospiraceae bacterium]|nr:excinuclease ABC subunit UvrC [Lachnospiraceae bacterium]